MEEELISSSPARLRCLLVAVIAPFLCCLQFGVVIGYSSPAIPQMQAAGIIDKSSSDWFASLMTLGGLLGCPLAGYFVELFGRKTTLAITNIPFFVGWLLICSSLDVTTLFTGRFLTGLSGGMVTVVASIYISEVSTVRLRGTLGTGVQLNITLGILLVYLLGSFMDWRNLALMGCILSVISELALYFSPETPRYYILKGKQQEAITALNKLRGSEYDCSKECRQIEDSFTDSKPVTLLEFTKPALLRPLKVAIGLMLLQQLTGINVVMFYTVTIFREAGYGANAEAATVAVGVAQAVVTLLACYLMDVWGRRPLLLCSAFGMSAACFSLAGFYATPDASRPPLVAVASLVFYIAAFGVGWGPCPMLLNSEIFPLRCRGAATAVATVASWSTAFLITSQYSNLAAVVGGTGGVFCTFGVCGLLGAVFVFAMVPETKNKSLEEIEKYFRGRASRK